MLDSILNLDSILKSRDITLPTKVHLVRAMVFPVVMYGYESWTMYEEGWAPKNWCVWTVVLEKTLESPWTARRSNQPILKEISPEYSVEGLMLKLKLPIVWPPDAKTWLIWKHPDAGRLRAGGEGDDRGWDGWMASQTPTWVWVGDGKGSLVCWWCPWGYKE